MVTVGTFIPCRAQLGASLLISSRHQLHRHERVARVNAAACASCFQTIVIFDIPAYNTIQPPSHCSVGFRPIGLVSDFSTKASQNASRL
eukprot:5283833-Pleurochrysis_carterae.AAC.1